MTVLPSTEYHRRWRARHQAADTVPHGTDNGYAGYGCRCSRCRRAHRDARRAERAKASVPTNPERTAKR